MVSKLNIQLEPEPSPIGESVSCTLHFNDADMLGVEAEVNLRTSVKVKDSRPVNRQRSYQYKKFIVNEPIKQLTLDATVLDRYSYFGTNINIQSEINIVVDDAIFFDSKKTKTITRQILKKPTISHKYGALVNPTDKQNFFNNLRSLPQTNRNAIYRAILLGGISIVSFLFIAIHDLWVGRELSYVYSSFFIELDWRFFMIFFITVFGTAMSYMVARGTIRKHLSSWLFVTKNKNKFPRHFPLKGHCRVSDLIQGKTSVPLDEIKVRIIACNVECGQYTRGSGTQQRTVSFASPVREYILFEKNLKNIAKGVNIGDYLNDTVYFNTIYKNLYPRNMLSPSHGIKHYWEVQFLHENFIDHEVQLPVEQFDNSEFYK